MKLLIGAVVSFALLAAVNVDLPTIPSTGPGGWETGGGDLWALQFVKIGRALGEQMDHNGSGCSALRRLIDPRLFQQAVTTAHVSSVNGTPANVSHSIQFNRHAWYNTSVEEQIAEVFKGYSVMALAKPVSIDSSVTSDCLPRADRERIFGHFRESAEGSAPRFLREFHEASIALKGIILNHSEELGSWSIPSSQLLAILSQAEHVDRLNGKGEFILNASATPIRFQSGEMKDGRNSKLGRSLIMSLNESVWVRSSQAQRVELLFHECLGLADVDDSRYQLSSRIWKLVPAPLYAML